MSTAPDQPRRPPRPAAEACPADGNAQVREGAGQPRNRADACPGALRLHPADDGALARVRIPGGVLTAAQAERLGEAARRFGDGDVHLTSRGNVQLRGLGAACGADMAQLLGAAGLLPSAAHERIRNIVASPLSGLDGRGHLDVGEWLRALDGLLCGSETAAALSGRFLFALDDGRGDVAALAPDVTLRAAPDGTALLRVGRNPALRLPAADAPRAALLAAEAFVTSAAPDGGEPTAWRVADLPDRGGALTAALADRLPEPLATEPAPPSASPDATRGKAAPTPPTASPALGPIPHPDTPGGPLALSVLAPLGRLTTTQWRALTALAARTPAAHLRLTPWRGAVVPGVPADRVQEELATLAAAGLVTDTASPWVGVSACAGRPGCAKSLADVRADAAAFVHPAPGDGEPVRPTSGSGEPGDGPTPARPLPVHWSGCSRGCGRPRTGDRVDVVATSGGYRVDLFRTGAPPRSAHPRPSDLAATVAAARRGAPIE
ncbi:precorrin-3B synthase [Streptomyces sp. NBC_00448]|uniref:precorrin-3B synthase n=1 Tax=Streptomyces sp. NBC_00448 TaxID=2903652 RepID=UPI002E201401